MIDWIETNVIVNDFILDQQSNVLQINYNDNRKHRTVLTRAIAIVLRCGVRA